MSDPVAEHIAALRDDDWAIREEAATLLGGLKDPRAVVPESVMPPYAFLAEKDLKAGDMSEHLKALSAAGVPYTKKDIEQANADLAAQADPDADAGDLLKRYPKAQIRDYDGNPGRLTEMDALIAYLQMLGTLVDFKAAAPQETGK